MSHLCPEWIGKGIFRTTRIRIFILSPPFLQARKGRELANSPEKSKNLGYQDRKFRISLASTSHLRFPRAFIEVFHLFSGAEFKAVFKLWDWFQSPEVRHHEQFTIGRAKLAQLAGVGEMQANSALKKLERLGFISALPGKGGRKVAQTYVWKWGNITGVLYQNDTSVVSKQYNELYQNDTSVVSERYNLYITSLLVLLNPSYSIAFGSSLMGNNEDALRAGALDGKGAALTAAIKHCWQRTAAKGGWPLHDIHAALMHLIQDEVEFLKKNDLRAYLYTV